MNENKLEVVRRPTRKAAFKHSVFVASWALALFILLSVVILPLLKLEWSPLWIIMGILLGPVLVGIRHYFELRR